MQTPTGPVPLIRRMAPHSLRTRLLGLWGLSLVACIAVALLLVQLFDQSTKAQIGRAEAGVARACDLIRLRYADQPRQDLAREVGIALAHRDGVEGGIWQLQAGSLAYAFPTYEGTGPKTDLPAAEREQIRSVNEAAARAGRSVDRRTAVGSQTLLLHACPLHDPAASLTAEHLTARRLAAEHLTAWTMTRVRQVQGFRPLQLGLGVLLALMLGMSAWLGRTLFVWGRHVRGIEAALRGTGAGGGVQRMPVLARTGERELDQIIDALNQAGLRLAEAREEADSMARRVSRAERLAGLGRIAAGVAHEIRNPVAAARLQGENALAGDDARRREAIGEMLEQIDRLDGLVGELLAMTQRVDPLPVAIDLDDFLEDRAGRHRAVASARSVSIEVDAPAAGACLDPVLVGRILDNLLTNAIRHAPAGGSVKLAAALAPRSLSVSVADGGPGIAPGLADRLFEPFVTGRPDGIGLGLAIARELADAHGGRLLLATPRQAQGGAVFVLELPQEGAWQRS